MTKLEGWEPIVRVHEPGEDVMVLFKEKDDGSIDPTLVVGTQLPLPPGLIKAKPIRRTWWREE